MNEGQKIAAMEGNEKAFQETGQTLVPARMVGPSASLFAFFNAMSAQEETRFCVPVQTARGGT